MTDIEGRLDVEVLRSAPIDAVERVWRSIEDRGDGSFFTSWLWIGAWLRCVRPDAWLVVAARDCLPVGAALVVRAPRNSLAPLRTQYRLHETGIARTDSLFIEYNAMLADRSSVQAVSSAILQALRREASSPWWILRNEFIVSGTTPNFAAMLCAQSPSTQITRRERSPFVDLARLRRDGIPFLDSLSANARQQLRRAKRSFEALGPLNLERAKTEERALEFLAALKPLHIARWLAKGNPSGFDNPAFEPMLRDLIAHGIASGAVDVLRLAAGEHRLGYLVNFVYRGSVMNYTSGFDYGSDRQLKPGLVSHLLAIEDANERGALTYKFLAGATRYKDSLSTDSEELVWLRMRL